MERQHAQTNRKINLSFILYDMQNYGDNVKFWKLVGLHICTITSVEDKNC